MKTLAITAITTLIISLSSARAAVLVTTGTTSDGKAYVTIPDTEFKVNFSSSGITGIELDFVNAWATPGMVTVAAGSGLSFSSLANPAVVQLTNWSDHAMSGKALSDRDSVILAPTASYSYQSGDIITLEGGTFTLTSTDPAFQIFPSGSYTVYLVATVGGFSAGPLTEAGVAVPEPSTWALAAVGVVGILAWRRKSRQPSLAGFSK